MLQKLYTVFIRPRQKSEDLRNRELVLNLLLAGTLVILIFVLPILSVGYLLLHHNYVSPVMLMVVCAVLYVGYLYRLSRKGYFRTAASLLVAMYFFIAAASVFLWGVNIPSGILLFGLVIVLSGILLGPNHALYSAGLIAVTLTLLELGADSGILHPDVSWVTEPPTMGDVLGSCLIFGVIALTSWLFNHQMERSLHRAEKAEAALLKQKSLLEVTVEERTRELQAAQLEKIQQMYRFAELGQLSTAMMHDLANHLTSLTFNIESLEGEKRSKVLSQAKRSIRHIDDMVQRVRDQLHGRAKIRTFNVVSEIDEIVKMLKHRGHMDGVELDWKPPADKKALRCRGEPVRFRQMIANLIANGFDAYKGMAESNQKRVVLVAARNNKSEVMITIEDWGCGIPAKERSSLFEPFYSTKGAGMGMGLFIVRQIAEEHFSGSVGIDGSQKHTSFVIKIPKVD